MNSKVKTNVSLNFIKCIAILGMVCIHCSYYKLGDFGFTVDALSRFCVPIFFLISGFFSYYADRTYAMEKYKTRIIRLVVLLIIALVLYYVVYNFLGIRHIDIASLLSIGALFKYIVFNVSPVGMHLWFIQALIYCYAIYFLMGKFNIRFEKLYYLIPVLLIMNLFLGEISVLIGFDVDPAYYRNFLFTGLPFFTLGYLIRQKEYIVKEKFSNAFTVIAIVASLILIVIESFYVRKVIDLYVGTILFSTLLLIYCANNPLKLNIKLFTWIGANLYTPMYIFHVMCINIFYKCLGFNRGYFDPIILFIMTALLSLIPYLLIKTFTTDSEDKDDSLEKRDTEALARQIEEMDSEMLAKRIEELKAEVLKDEEQ